MSTNRANKADSISNKEFLIIICASNNKTPRAHSKAGLHSYFNFFQPHLVLNTQL